jgi:short subunit dehydrogenase-like uncharacterized protein
LNGGWLIYGANGYTGELTARAAVARGQRPVLAGRSRAALEPLARELGLEARCFALDEPKGVDAGLAGVAAVLHCAGPFSRTALPMAEACLRRKVHYLDITGEVTVFESLHAMDSEARAAGVMLLPGAGFDVVPSDCLAAHLKRRLPSATRLLLAFASSGGFSRGTRTTMIENIDKGGLIRKDGRLTPVPSAWRTRQVDFGRGPRACVTIPWGDVSTAFYSTGIPNVEVCMAAPLSMRLGMRLTRPFSRLLASKAAQRYLLGRIRSGAPGPSAETRARARAVLWGEVADERGGHAAARLRTPDGYTLTVLTSLAIAERVLRGEAPPGFQTPSLAYGPDFVLAIEGVTREDVAR